MGLAQPIYDNDLSVTNCGVCGVVFAMPAGLHRNLKEDEDKWFHCPNGHRLHYADSAVKKLEEELQRANEKVVESNRLRWQQEERAVKAERKLKRVHRGVCPECNRSFQDVERHMKTKHSKK